MILGSLLTYNLSEQIKAYLTIVMVVNSIVTQ